MAPKNPTSKAPDHEGSERYSGNRLPRGEWVYDRLTQEIQAGRFKFGERIREEEVARQLGVSRTPVREALSRLRARGLLELTPFGLVVTTLTRSQVLELYAMREILEGSAARFAAQHASASEVGALYSIAEAFSRELGNPERLAQLNRQLHAAIYEAAHNRYLMRTLGELHDTTALLPSTTFTVEGRPEAAVHEHGAIIAAIEKRDAELAERTAREHIRKAQEGRLSMMLKSDYFRS